jgi:hypothetical protein
LFAFELKKIMGKEAYCFGSRHGWVLMMFGFLIMVLASLILRANHIFNSLGFSFLFHLMRSSRAGSSNKKSSPPVE